MSKKIDERVVEMQFDNKNFEKNVSTTMSTIDKLKEKLKFEGAAKGLEDVSKSVKNVDMSSLSKGVDTVSVRFSALQVAAVTALSNITNSVLTAGKNLISAFTIDPITSGFKEYELQMNSIQTIMANTASKGTTMDQVTAALNELNEYADLTIYKFAEMTRNIGTFTAAGVDLDKSVAAIKGIANLGAMSGSTAQQVNTAMYQLSQALAAGKVSLMDWNSVVNAGMGGEQLQNALIRTAQVMGTGVDAALEKYGTFRESLTNGAWLTADVLTETLNQISGAYSEADLIAQGYSESQAKAIVEMANTATDAATKVKTFTQLMDTLQEAAGSGWAQTWQIVLGDFEEAKEFFTGISDYLGEIIGNMSDARNEMLAGAFDSNWTKLGNEIEKAGVPLDTFTDKLKTVAKEHNIDIGKMIEEQGSLEKVMQTLPNSGDLVRETIDAIAGSALDLNESTVAMTDKLEYFQKVVDEVWNGDYLNGQERVEALTKAGYDYAEVQELVNKTVDGQKLKLEDLSESQMEAIGFTEEQVAALKKLSAEAKKSGSSISELIDNLEKPSGRQLLLDSLSNGLKAILEPLRAIGRAFNEVFGLSSDQVYKALEAVNRFSKAILMSDETLDKLTRTFKGIFSVIKIFTSFIGGTFGIAFNALTLILENFNLGILDVTAFIGDLLTAFSEWLTSGEMIRSVIQGIGDLLSWILTPLRQFIDGFLRFPAVSSAFSTVKGFFDSITKSFSDMLKLDPKDAVKKTITTIYSAAKTAASGIISWVNANFDLEESLGVINKVCSKVIEPIKEFFAPFAEIPIIKSATSAIKDFFNTVQNYIKSFKDLDISEIGYKFAEDFMKAFDKLKNLSWDDVLNALSNFSTKAREIFKDVVAMIKEVGPDIIKGLQNGLKDGVEGIFEFMREIGGKIIEAIKEVLGIHSPSTVMITIGGMIVAGLIVGITSQLDSVAEVFSSLGEKIKNVLMGIDWGAVAVVVASGLSFAILYKLTDALQMFGTAAKNVTAPLAGAGKVMTSISEAIDTFTGNIKGGTKFQNIANAVKTLATSILMLAASIVVLTMIDQTKLWPAVGALAALTAILAVAAAAFAGITVLLNKFGGSALNTVQLMGTVVSVSAALLILAAAAKIIGSLDTMQLERGRAFIMEFVAITAALMAASQFAGKNAGQMGTAMLKFSAAILIMIAAVKLLGDMDQTTLDQGMKAVEQLGVVLGVIGVVSGIAGSNASQMGTAFIKFSAAMIIMAGAIKLLGDLEQDQLEQGMAVISAFVVVLGALALVSRMAKSGSANLGTNLLAMSASILILAGVIKILETVNWQQNWAGILIGLVALTAVIAALVAITKLAGNNSPKIAATLLGMSLSIGVLAGISVLLGMVDPAGLTQGIVAVGALTVFMMGLLVASQYAAEVKMGTIIAIVSGIAVLAVSVAALSFLDPVRLTIATTALGILLGMFALILKAASNVNGSLAVVITIGVVIAELAAAIYLLAGLPIESTIASAASLSVLLLSLAVSMKILSTIQSVSVSAMAAITVLGLIAAGLAYVLSLLNPMDPAASIGTAVSLSVLLTAMAGVTAILSAVGKIGGAAAALQGVAAFSIVVVAVGALMTAIGALEQYFPGMQKFLSTGIVILNQVASGIGQFVGNLIGGVLTGISGGLASIGIALSTFMIGLNPFIVGASNIDSSVVDGVGSLVAAILALTAGTVINAIASFLTGGSSMQDFADQLVPFGEAMVEFSNTVSGKIDESAVMAAASAGKMIGEMAKNLPKSGGLVQSLFGENQDLGDFSTKLTQFGEAIVAFSDTVTGKVDQAGVEAAAAAGKVISEFSKELPRQGGFLQDFFGEQDLGLFSEQLTAFGEAIVSFSQTVSGNVDQAGVEAAAAAGQTMAELANNIPSSGGFLQDFLGEQDIADFGEQLVQFGKAIVDFSQIVSGNVSEEAVTAAANAGMTMSSLANNLPKSGGFLQALLGEQSMADFGTDLESFGESFKAYAGYMEDVDPSITLITTAAAISLKTLSDSIEGGLFTDKTKLTDFGSDLSGFGENFAAFYGYIDEVDTTILSSVITEFYSLLYLLQAMSSSDMTGASNFKDAMNNLAKTGIQDFINTFQNSASQATEAVKSTINSLAATITNNQHVFKQAFETMITQTITAINNSVYKFRESGNKISKGFVDGVKQYELTIISTFQSILNKVQLMVSGYYFTFETMGKMLMSNMVSGVNSKSGDFTASFETAISSAKTSISGYYNDFTSLGGYLAQGFAAGIDANSGLIAEKAASAARKAYTSAMNALDAHSPSRLFMKVGGWLAQGFAIGIENSTGEVETASVSMADAAITKTKDAIAMLSDAIKNGIDSQPTIRPVLDLSAVEEGANSLDTMFSRNRALSVSSSIASARAGAAGIQNGTETTAPVTTNQFIQNNYSPKALSNIEIYRQTKNLFSAMERKVTG